VSPVPSLVKSSRVSVSAVSNTGTSFLKWRIGRSAVIPAFQGHYGQNSLVGCPCDREEQIPNEKYPRKKEMKKKKKTKVRSLLLLLILNCLASLGHGKEDIVHWLDSCLVSGT